MRNSRFRVAALSMLAGGLCILPGRAAGAEGAIRVQCAPDVEAAAPFDCLVTVRNTTQSAWPKRSRSVFLDILEPGRGAIIHTSGPEVIGLPLGPGAATALRIRGIMAPARAGRYICVANLVAAGGVVAQSAADEALVVRDEYGRLPQEVQAASASDPLSAADAASEEEYDPGLMDWMLCHHGPKVVRGLRWRGLSFEEVYVNRYDPKVLGCVLRRQGPEAVLKVRWRGLSREQVGSRIRWLRIKRWLGLGYPW